MYQYKARLVRVVDGDTFEADVDLGFGVSIRHMFRLDGVSCEGVTTEAGRKAKDFLSLLLTKDPNFTIQTRKDRKEKYGRMLATVYLSGHSNSVNEILIESGHAVRRDK